MIKDGIILTSGKGSRLQPFSNITNKHLLNLNNKFVIDYPLNTLKQMGVENLTVLLGSNHYGQIVEYLKDGEEWGFNINYCYQKSPAGIAQAINLCKNQVINKNNFAVILGDNIYEDNINWDYQEGSLKEIGAKIVLSYQEELKRFGVASIDENKKIIKIEEKPQKIDYKYSNYAITGCYLFNPEYFDFFKRIKPSARNEYEITDIISLYHSQNILDYIKIAGFWGDAGTKESLMETNNYLYNNNIK